MKTLSIAVFLMTAMSNAAWDYDIDTDLITDETITTLSTVATSGRNSWGDHPTLTIRFTDGDAIEIFIRWGVYVGSSDLTCIVRVDDDEARTYRLNPSTNRRSTFFRGYSHLEELFVKMLDGSELVCRFTPYGENPITAIFSLYGLTNAAINGGIDIEAYRQRVAETEQRQVEQRGEGPAVGDSIMFQGELHRIMEIEYGRDNRLSRAYLVPLDAYIADHNASGYRVTANQLDMYGGDQEAPAVGDSIMFRGELHRIMEIEYGEYNRLSRAYLVSLEAYNADKDASGYWVTASQIEMYGED